MYFKIKVIINSNIDPKKIDFSQLSFTPFKARPIKFQQRLGTYINKNSSSFSGNKIFGLLERPGGMFKGFVNTDDDCNKGAILTIQTNKLEKDLNIQTCDYNNPECNALKNMRQSNSKINNQYYPNSTMYFQNRNMSFRKKEEGFLSREDSMKIYNSYDKQKFYIPNHSNTDSAKTCEISYFKPNNVMFSQQGGVNASGQTSRKKYNNTKFCEVITPKNTFFHDSYKVINKDIFGSCCYPKETVVTLDILEDIFESSKSKLNTVKDMLIDNDINLSFEKVEPVGIGSYDIYYKMNNINFSELSITEIENLTNFLRNDFEKIGVTPELDVTFNGVDGLDYNKHFKDELFRFFVEIDNNYKINYLDNIFLKESNPFIQSLDYVVDTDNLTHMRFMLNNVEDSFLDNEEQQEQFFQYISNIYFYKFGVRPKKVKLITN